LEKLNAQLARLQGMAGAKAKPELKQWINQRLRILSELVQSKL
jgi:hypothetical protein